MILAGKVEAEASKIIVGCERNLRMAWDACALFQKRIKQTENEASINYIMCGYKD